MDIFWKLVLWKQFGAAIDMLENAMQACPDQVWSDPSERPEWASNGVVGFWYLAYHTLFFLDLYLSGSTDGFRPLSPFNLDELDPAGLLPERPFTKNELQIYLEHCRQKCRGTIESLTEEKAHQSCGIEWLDVSFAELLLYNMRHVQHHAAQLNLILRQETAAAPRWVVKTKVPITSE